MTKIPQGHGALADSAGSHRETVSSGRLERRFRLDANLLFRHLLSLRPDRQLL